MSINYVRFQRGSVAAYNALGTPDKNTLYFIYENEDSGIGSLYLGEKLISGGSDISKATLDQLADVIVDGAATDSFLVKDSEGNWVAKTLTEVVEMIKENLDGVSASASQVFKTTLNDGESHEAAIARMVGENNLVSSGDIAIIKSLIADDKYQHTAYVYDGEKWRAMDGNYSASTVYTPEDIPVTVKVGELPANTVVNAGTNVTDLLTRILSQSKNPTKTEPKITSFSVTGDGSNTSFEAGSTITPQWNSTFSAGSYSYKSSVSNTDIIPVSGTGVTVESWSIKQGSTEIGTTEDGTGTEFVLGDDAVTFTATANYSDGNYALTNLNKLPETEVRIVGSSSSKTASITSYRKMFAGGTTATEITSDLIRNLGTNREALTSEFEFKANVGDTKLILAYPESLTSNVPSFEYFTMAWESVGGFVKLENPVQVADARGGSEGLVNYTVYTYTPAAAYAAETKYKVLF